MKLCLSNLNQFGGPTSEIYRFENDAEKTRLPSCESNTHNIALNDAEKTRLPSCESNTHNIALTLHVIKTLNNQ